MVLQMMQKINEFEYKLNTIYFIFIIHTFYAAIYKQYFEFLLIYDFMSTLKLV